MSDTISYENCKLEIIVNRRLKHSYISIDRDKNILIKTPYKSRQFVDSLLKEKSSWIEKQLVKIEKTTLLEDTELYSIEFIEGRVRYFSDVMNLTFTKLKFRKMRSRWGSCNSKREITLNSQLTRVNRELIDYVVVHELAHIQHMNHSKSFHTLVESYLTNSKEYRKELKNIRLT